MGNRLFLNHTNLETVVSILFDENFLRHSDKEPQYKNHRYSNINVEFAKETINKFDLKSIASNNLDTFYRETIKKIILNYDFIITRNVLRGPIHLVDQLTINEKQCFKNAGLIEELPTKEAIEWWDSIKETLRDKDKNKKIKIGRLAEEMSFYYEKEKLKKYELNHKVIWKSAYDDMLGYDILSCDNVGKEKYIEVKKSSSSIDRFILTRNEWNRALGKKNSYFIHLWNHKNDLRIIKFDELSKLVLENKEKTKWLDLEIKP